jgi:hypothetical protein
MSRELHKKKNKELYALYSTITDNYITRWESKEKIKEIWTNDLIEEVRKKVEEYMKDIDKEV